jgi:hypothetical protein
VNSCTTKAQKSVICLLKHYGASKYFLEGTIISYFCHLKFSFLEIVIKNIRNTLFYSVKPNNLQAFWVVRAAIASVVSPRRRATCSAT